MSASHESCVRGWEIFKYQARTLEGLPFGNPDITKWGPTTRHARINEILVHEGFDPVSAHTYRMYRRLFKQGTDYTTVNEGHYGRPIQAPWEPIAFGTGEAL